MTTAQIERFIGRLMRRELSQDELAALTTRDLDAINQHLAKKAEAALLAQGRICDGLSRSGPHPAARPTYTEEEILVEFGMANLR